MDVKLKGFKRKYILKQSMGDLLPDQFLAARKLGFRMPANDWYAEDTIKDIYSSSVGRLEKLLNLNGFLAGKDQPLNEIFYRDSFWTLMALANKI